MNAPEAYRKLVSRSREISHLDSAMELAYWDQRINVPAKGHAHRVRHLAALWKMRYRRFTDSRIGDLLAIAENSPFMDDPASVEAVNLREWRRLHHRLKQVPEKLAIEIVRIGTEAEAVWERARPKNNWRRIQPLLERIVVLKRQEAEALGYEHEPYDALLADYELGETAGVIDALLKKLIPAILRVLDRLKEGGEPWPESPVTFGAPMSEQEAFAHDVAHCLGYGMEGGRIDVSAHPFATGLGPGDVRITARYREGDVREGLFGVVHEAGHATYVQGLPMDHWGEPLCHVASLGIDESQSLLWEYFVARSRGFWNHFYPVAQSRFPNLAGISPDAFYKAVNAPSPGSLRVNADELTYNLHIALRFDLERALVNQDLEVTDLPGAWDEKSMAYLSRRPSTYGEGVMQDVHWYSGLIGYFPTYTLGHLYAAQFFRSAEKELGNLDEFFSHGDFTALRQWLRDRIHSHGARFLPRQLVRNVTGEGLDPMYLVRHLEEKYSQLYER